MPWAHDQGLQGSSTGKGYTSAHADLGVVFPDPFLFFRFTFSFLWFTSDVFISKAMVTRARRWGMGWRVHYISKNLYLSLG